MIKKRGAGVLLNVSSLPGPFGIGVFGEEACLFVDFLANMGFSYWQILPLGNVDNGNSPYSGDSSLAGNVLYIDPRELLKEGLVSERDVKDCIYGGSPYTADYDFVREKNERLLRKAYKNAENSGKYEGKIKIFRENFPWVGKYGEYKALGSDLPAEFFVFCQYLFFTQWLSVKKYANSKGVKIIGDMPLYVSGDSCDVWANPELFRNDGVAGVPPDYFSEEGQLWGNPLYDWDAMEKSGYKWWKDRIENSLKIYDILRFDHFRGLASYWHVPKDAKSAKEGHWEEGPGMKLFKALNVKNMSEKFIAEDLGVFGKDVIKLLKDTGLPGMRVIQFAFDGSRDSIHLPHKISENTVYYLGTHDNNTLLGWLWAADSDERRYALDYCGYKGDRWGDGGYKSESCRAIIETVWKSTAKIAVIAFQDMCGFGCDARMNIPGVPDKNWRFRTTTDTINGVDKEYFKKINELYGRIS